MTGVKKSIVAAAVLSVAAFAVYRYDKYETGIRETERAIQSMSQVIAQDHEDSMKLLQKLTAEAAENTNELLAISGNDPWATARELISQYKKIDDAVKAADGVMAGDLGMATSNIAKLTARLLSQTSKQLEEAGVEGLGPVAGPLAKYGPAVIDLSVKTYAAIGITKNFAAHKKTLFNLEKALGRLESSRDQHLWDNILRSLGDDQALQDAWLKEHNVDKTAVRAAAINTGMLDVGPRGANEISRGIFLVDPAQGIIDLQQTPNINPDFIVAMQATNIAAAQCAATGQVIWCNYSASTYPDGKYIPAFGPCLGVEFLVPVGHNQTDVRPGGILSSSVAECGKSPQNDGNNLVFDKTPDPRFVGHWVLKMQVNPESGEEHQISPDLEYLEDVSIGAAVKGVYPMTRSGDRGKQSYSFIRVGPDTLQALERDGTLDPTWKYELLSNGTLRKTLKIPSAKVAIQISILRKK